MIEKNRISIATMTLVRNEEEEKLLCESLELLAGYDIPVFITDGGSPVRFLEFLKRFPHFFVAGATVKGLLAQVGNSLEKAYASGSEIILYTEPDKKFFFRELDGFLAKAVMNEKTGIFLASRDKEGFDSYPEFQQMTETCINNCCHELTGCDLDYTYGPFLLNRKLIPALKFLKEDIGWGWRLLMFGLAHRLGFQLDEFVGTYLCPPDQRAESPGERIYRMRQLEQSIRGCVLSTSIETGET